MKTLAKAVAAARDPSSTLYKVCELNGVEVETARERQVFNNMLNALPHKSERDYVLALLVEALYTPSEGRWLRK